MQLWSDLNSATDMVLSPLIRRVSIYLVLSSAAVGALNLLDLEQSKAYTVYIPLFIGIYVLSRWIDSKFSAVPDAGKKAQPEATKTSETSDRGFGT